MPIIAHSDLPSYSRLEKEGEIVLSKDRASSQTIRELHIGLLNMMPDAALEATERQFFRLIGNSNQIAQFFVHPFTLDSINRSNEAKQHIKKFYKTFDDIKSHGLDALIITGAHIEDPDLSKAPFLKDLGEVIDWSYNNVTSTLCSCLTSHAVMELKYQQKRVPLKSKCWGVFPHNVMDRSHPLVRGVNTIFDVPHSRFNEVNRSQFEKSNLKILVDSEFGPHLVVSEDGLRTVLFQGHPEYDTISLLKEYKRDLNSYLLGKKEQKPPYPDNYLSLQAEAILDEFNEAIDLGKMTIDDFPEALLSKDINNTWHDTTIAIINNWIGCVYQVTNKDIKKPFMDKINPNDPLNLY
jgi:homoserine O-succinyltransferase